MNIRETIENREKLTLNKYATLSKDTRGRKVAENEEDIRTCFMRDRDRIVHTKSFRRLKHKTQVFIKTSGDHYRTRLTHTLEVAQIARTIAKGIGLNDDLVDAIALGHDIGHVAFAHNGEEVLNELMPNGFKHNANSIRVLTRLEKNGSGLNLTEEVLDGILHHSGFGKNVNEAFTLEGQVVKYADKIAYVNHDIDDSIRAGLIVEEDLPSEYINILGHTNSDRINKLVHDIIYNTINNLEIGNIKVNLSEEVGYALTGLRSFMFKEVYKGNILREERDKAKFVFEQVFMYYVKNEDKLPKFYRDIAKEEGTYQGVCDYIGGMSDDYCIHLFNELYVPKIVIY